MQLAKFVFLSLLISSCGGGDDTGESGDKLTQGAKTNTAPSNLPTPTTPTPTPTEPATTAGDAPDESVGAANSTATETDAAPPTESVEPEGPNVKPVLREVPTVKLAGDLKLTKENTVTLQLSFVPGIKTVEYNEVGCTSGDWTSYPYKTWLEIPFTKRNSLVFIYVRFVGGNGATSDCTMLSFSHDDEAPRSYEIRINDGASLTNNAKVSLRLVSDYNAKEVYVTNTENCGNFGTWHAYSSIVDMQWDLDKYNAVNTVYAKFRDEAGNESPCVQASIVHDNTPPTGSFKINYDAEKTVSASVTLNSSVFGATKMAIFDSTSDCSFGTTNSWQTYSPLVNWILPSRNTTASPWATVYVKFKDEAGNETICLSDTILTPVVTLTYQWFEGDYYPAYPTCGFPEIDYTTYKTKAVTFPPFSTPSRIAGCSLSGSGDTYTCDWSSNLNNCQEGILWTSCNGRAAYFTYPGSLRCTRPVGIPY